MEDENAARQLAETIFESYGYHVPPATSGPAAIALADRFPKAIHLLLSDLLMPGMDGKMLARNLKSSRPEMKVLLMSGYVPAVAGSEAGDSSIAYLSKPFEPRLLASKVRQILDAV